MAELTIAFLNFMVVYKKIDHILVKHRYKFLAVLGCGIMLIKKHDDTAKFAPQVSLIGFWIFMMLWESNHRQLINQWSIFLIVGAIGLGHIYNILLIRNKK